MFSFKQFFNVFAAHTSWVVGNTLFMERSVAQQVLCLWNKMSIEQLHKEMKDNPSLSKFFVIDNDRLFYLFCRILLYNFETELLTYFPDDPNRMTSEYIRERDLSHILLLLQEFALKEELTNPISISLKRKKNKYIQTAVMEYYRRDKGLSEVDNF